MTKPVTAQQLAKMVDDFLKYPNIEFREDYDDAVKVLEACHEFLKAMEGET